MTRILLLTLAVILTAAPCRAQWGWPPPGYSTSTRVAPDGSRYRTLCEVLRDRRTRRQACGVAPGTVGQPSLPAPAAETLPQPREAPPASARP